MNQRLVRIAAWSLIVAIFIMTDAPVGLRPTLGFAPNAERLLAFVVVGLLFVIAYPRRVGLVLALLIAAAGSFELLQLQAFGRHGYLKDFFVKSAGAGIGVMCGALINRLGERL